MSSVEKPGFLQLVTRLKAPHLIIRGRTFFTNFLETRFREQQEKLILALEEATDVGATLDLWSSRRKTYLGETIHWYNNELVRKNASLPIKRIIGNTSYNVLARHIEASREEFHIDQKMSMATTDNGSNFIKCFREYGSKSATPRMVECSDEEEDTDDFVYISLGDIFDGGECSGSEEDGLGIHLPPHTRCACHLLNLVSTVDVDKIADTKFQKLRTSVEEKLQTLCNKQSSSSQHSDFIKEKLDNLFILKNQTRWNSMYESMFRLYRFLKNKKKELETVMSHFGITHFRPVEVEYVREYLMIMEVISVALDILQGEKNIGMGYLLPTITVVKRDLQTMLQLGRIRHCKPLVQGLLSSISKR